jgi:hypothetical protein
MPARPGLEQRREAANGGRQHDAGFLQSAANSGGCARQAGKS